MENSQQIVTRDHLERLTLWKVLITLAKYMDSDKLKAEEARRVIGEMLADHEQSKAHAS